MLQFTTEIAQTLVKINSEWYVVVEADGAASRAYVNATAERVVLVDGSPSQLKGAGDLQSLLVSLCLKKVTDYEPEIDENDNLLSPIPTSHLSPVPQRTIEKWPARIQKALELEAKKLSDMEGESTTSLSLKKALEGYNSPISYQELSEYVGSLPEEKDFEAAKALLKDVETEAKND